MQVSCACAHHAREARQLASLYHSAGPPNRLTNLLQLNAEVSEFRTQALAESTRGQYDAHVRYFFSFCAYFGVSAVEPSERLICAYVALQARTVTPGTVETYLKGLKDHYRSLGYTQFADPVLMRGLYQTMKGIKRAKQHVAKQKVPITPGMLLYYNSLMTPGKPFHAALWAACLFGFFGFFRKSNLAVKFGSAFSDGKCIRYCDVKVIEKDYCLVVTPPGSKTRQYGAAPAVVIAGCKGRPLDAVQAWKDHLAASGVPMSGDITAFSHVAGS